MKSKFALGRGGNLDGGPKKVTGTRRAPASHSLKNGSPRHAAPLDVVEKSQLNRMGIEVPLLLEVGLVVLPGVVLDQRKRDD